MSNRIGSTQTLIFWAAAYIVNPDGWQHAVLLVLFLVQRIGEAWREVSDGE